MPRTHPLPYYKKSHKAWYVQIERRQIRLHPEREKAFTLYHQMMAEPARATPPATPASVPVAEVLEKFLEWCRRQRKQDTYEWYRWRLKRFHDDIGNRLTVAELKPFHLDDWFAKHPDWSGTTKHGGARAVLRAFHQKALS